MRALERFVLWLADMDWGWWPLLTLRPAKDRDFDSVRVLKLSLAFGSAGGVVAYAAAIVGSGFAMSFSLGMLALWAIAGVPLFAILFSPTTALCWNRRARRLRAEAARAHDGVNPASRPEQISVGSAPRV